MEEVETNVDRVVEGLRIRQQCRCSCCAACHLLSTVAIRAGQLLALPNSTFLCLVLCLGVDDASLESTPVERLTNMISQHVERGIFHITSWGGRKRFPRPLGPYMNSTQQKTLTVHHMQDTVGCCCPLPTPLRAGGGGTQRREQRAL